MSLSSKKTSKNKKKRIIPFLIILFLLALFFENYLDVVISTKSLSTKSLPEGVQTFLAVLYQLFNGVLILSIFGLFIYGYLLLMKTIPVSFNVKTLDKKNKTLKKQEDTYDEVTNKDDGLMNKIKRLKKLYINGTLTKDEFEKAKNKLLT